jgi:cytoskeletal protein CcmA (bactofilin family)
MARISTTKINTGVLMFAKKKQPAIKSLIAVGSHIEGNVKFADGLRVDGQITGDIRSNSEQPSILVISETATVTGQIFADHVIINGRVIGPVHATQMLELQPKAQIVGDVFYKALEMHQGAAITGLLQPTLQEFEVDVKAPLKLASSNK